MFSRKLATESSLDTANSLRNGSEELRVLDNQ
jgi:hypothetical protein